MVLLPMFLSLTRAETFNKKEKISMKRTIFAVLLAFCLVIGLSAQVTSQQPQQPPAGRGVRGFASHPREAEAGRRPAYDGPDDDGHGLRARPAASDAAREKLPPGIRHERDLG